jgi:general secretion pathway protein G
LAKRKSRTNAILLAWESRGGIVGRLGLSRVRPFIAVAIALTFIVFLAVRDRQRTGERATRASLLVARRALDSFRADHEGKCPHQLEELQTAGYVLELPDDAWGHPLRLVCPGRTDPTSYDLMSDGPDGEPGGLDRIE